MKQPTVDRHLYRTARAVHVQLEHLRRKRIEAACRQARLLTQSIGPLMDSPSKIGRCLCRGWQLTVEGLIGRMAASVSQLPAYQQQLHSTLEDLRKPLPSLREILEDLRQLQQECGPVRWSSEGLTLAVQTEPIVLQGIDLGPFEIRLDLTQMGTAGRAPYSVVALDPHPAAGDPNVCHPHVNGESLCEGDATGTVDRALFSGRLCDFFLLIRSVLRHYNPHSPYVSLDEWEGVCCADCGVVVSREESYACASCSRELCSECMGFCEGCREGVCPECLERCELCEQFLCPSCLTSCADCDRPACERCLQEGRCPRCNQEKRHEESQMPAVSRAAIPANAGQHPLPPRW